MLDLLDAALTLLSRSVRQNYTKSLMKKISRITRYFSVSSRLGGSLSGSIKYWPTILSAGAGNITFAGRVMDCTLLVISAYRQDSGRVLANSSLPSFHGESGLQRDIASTLSCILHVEHCHTVFCAEFYEWCDFWLFPFNFTSLKSKSPIQIFQSTMAKLLQSI